MPSSSHERAMPTAKKIITNVAPVDSAAGPVLDVIAVTTWAPYMTAMAGSTTGQRRLNSCPLRACHIRTVRLAVLVRPSPPSIRPAVARLRPVPAPGSSATSEIHSESTSAVNAVAATACRSSVPLSSLACATDSATNSSPVSAPATVRLPT
jgi:hypothetical protein